MSAPFFIFISLFSFQYVLAETSAFPNNYLQWQKLFHQHHNDLLIKDQNFLHTLKKNGDFKAEDEIQYWESIFSNQSKESSIGEKKSALLCQFPARYWLWSNGAKVRPEHLCPKLATFMSEFDREKVSLVFSSYYAQNAASLFGHTLLRFTRFNNKGQELLDWGISYSANMNHINPLSMLYKSFFSTFPGSLELMPYYYKVREYNDFEFRPLWSYTLKVEQKQIRFLLYHLWELSQLEIPYQYLTHNCSSLILDVLNILKPEVNFREELAAYHIPIDTVKVLKKYNLLEQQVSYRASIMQEWESKYQQLSSKEKNLFQSFAKNLDPQVLDSELLIDTALDYYDFKYGKELLSPKEEWKNLQQKKNDLLIKRSQYPVKQYPSVLTHQVSPENVHPTRRIGLGFMHDDDSVQRLLFNYRFAYHDPIDPTQGMTSRMKINFLRPELSINQNANLRLEKLELLDIASWSYSPVLSHSLTYEISTHWLRQIHVKDGLGNLEEIKVLRLAGAAGRTFDLSDHLYSALMLETQLSYSGQRRDDWGVKIGPQWMIHWDLEKWRLRLTAKKLYEVTSYQEYFSSLDNVEAMLSYTLSSNQVLSYLQTYTNNYNQSQLNWYYYY